MNASSECDLAWVNKPRIVLSPNLPMPARGVFLDI